MNKKSFCIANWKMNKNNSESMDFLKDISNRDLSISESIMIICPSITSLNAMIIENNNNNILFGSQNVSSFIKGSFTGEISISMLENIECEWVIIGHSERRLIINESDELVSDKMKIVYKSSINPILCIGETYDQKQAGLTENILTKQIHSAFEGISFKNKDILIAYAPIWAIGTGLAADIKTITNNVKIIKNIINNLNVNNCNIYIMYGGSVNEKNAAEIFNINDINGFLIGTSSLCPSTFYNIYEQI